MASPRFNQNLSDPLQIGQKGEISQSPQAVDEGPETRAITATAAVDHSQTTAGVVGDHSHSTLHRKLDERIRLRLAQLEILPGPVSGKGVEQSSQGVERGLPISLSGKAKGVDRETDVFVFRLRISKAKSIPAKAAVLRDLSDAIQTITVSRRKGRPEFDLSIKEGRIAAGRLSETHGVRWACEALGGVPERTMRRYRDEYRRAA